MKTPAFKLLLALNLALLASRAGAVLPEPGNWIYGTITISNVVAGADRSDLVVEARRATNGVAVASYRLGDKPAYGSRFFLELPVETIAANRILNSSTNGAVLYITLTDGTQDLAQFAYQVPDRGVFAVHNFVIGPSSADLFSQWLGANGVSGDGTGDADHDGLPDVSEYIAGTNPKDASDVFKLTIDKTPNVSFLARQAAGTGYAGLDRYYALEYRTNMTTGAWQGVSNYTNILGNNAVISYHLPSQTSPEPLSCQGLAPASLRPGDNSPPRRRLPAISAASAGSNSCRVAGPLLRSPSVGRQRRPTLG